MSQNNLMSWGRYPYFPQFPHAIEWRDSYHSVLQNLVREYQFTLPFGNGRSYGDSCLALSNHVLHCRSLNRFMEADWTTGQITAEAGVTLEEVLQISIPQGWFLPVTPGTKFVTLGGAIANDVHGKNHHIRGTFGNHVLSIDLMRSDTGLQKCSPGVNKDLFKATIGGLGLSGVIMSVKIQLMPIASSRLTTFSTRFETLDSFIDLSNELDQKHEYSVAWVDCAARGKNLGRGLYMVGDHCGSGELITHKDKKLTVPFSPPISAINQVTLKTFNQVYFHKHPRKPVYGVTEYDPFFYPLDGINHWNRIYGPKGFQQYQTIIPENNARDAVKDLLKIISDSGSGSFLAVLKRCGDIISPGVISFPKAGISLALDFAQSTHVNDQLFPKLDAVVRAANGRLYPAKDAHMQADDFQKYYPEWEKIEHLRDPKLISHFWQRVTQK